AAGRRRCSRAAAREHGRVPADSTGVMAGHGYYGAHSLPQGSAGAFGLPLLVRAVDTVRLPDDSTSPVVIADLGAAGGRNELGPLTEAIGGLRQRRGLTAPIVVVHTDLPTNDFTALFETVEHDPDSYLRAPDTYAFAAGRSFYERIFPAASVTLGWSAIAVHWLSAVPRPVEGHVWSEFATGATRDALAAQSAADWRSFLANRAVELRRGGQLVIVGGAAADDGARSAEGLMNALNDAIAAAVADGRLGENDYAAMTIPTWNRTLADFAAPFASVAELADVLTLEEHALHVLPDPFLADYERSGDAAAFADAETAFLRGFTEPSLFGTLQRPPDERRTLADAVYAQVRDRAAEHPVRVATNWRVAVLRIARR
ncbi:MAG: hypothetical protein ACRD12_05665, partial [Acidimicrobiales bacterium]